MTSASPLPPYSAGSSGQEAGAPPGPGAGQPQPQPGMSPAEKMLSSTVSAAAAPVAAARRVQGAKGGLPLYAGLGGLALVGVLEWPVAVAAGAGYGLARFWADLDRQPKPAPEPPGAETVRPM
jgi:hypothetical protein